MLWHVAHRLRRRHFAGEAGRFDRGVVPLVQMKVVRRSSKIRPALSQWAREAPPGATRTVVIRTAFSANAHELERAVAQVSPRVQRSGGGVLVAEVDGPGLQALEAIDGIVAVEPPVELRPI
jgi:hypothetical protein